MYSHIKALLISLVIFGCAKPDIAIHNEKGIFYQDTLGSWVIINYWADWCAPCIKEIPEIASFANNNLDKNVFAFNFDRVEGEELQKLIQKFGITYPSLITHPKTHWDLPTPKTLPATFIINQQGKLVRSFLTPISKDDLESYFSEIK